LSRIRFLALNLSIKYSSEYSSSSLRISSSIKMFKLEDEDRMFDEEELIHEYFLDDLVE
jgi:hypothetical protein